MSDEPLCRLHVLFTTPNVRLYLDVLLCPMVYSWIPSIPHAHVDNLAHSLVLQRETSTSVNHSACPKLPVVHVLSTRQPRFSSPRNFVCGQNGFRMCCTHTVCTSKCVARLLAVSCCETARALSVQSSRCVPCESLKQIIGVDAVHASLRDCLGLSFC